MKIKDISKEELPREKLKEKGVKILSNSELIALIINKGNKEENVIDLSHKIINKKPLHELKETELGELTKIKGIGEVKASQIIASIELGRRSFLRTNFKKTNINNSEKAFCEIANDFKGDQESFIVILLDSRNNLIIKKTMFIGTINQQIVGSREIVKLCIQNNAVKVILAHNHPSGNLEPSEADHKTTEKIENSLRLFNIELVDHIIVANEKYYSFKDEYLL